MELANHLNKLNYFIKVAEAGSIKEGSAQAFLSQPQMTKVIQQLEEAVGAQLFLRSKSGVKMTSAGAKFHEFAKETLKNCDSLTLSVKYQSAPKSGEISIGTYDSIARYFFPSFLRYFQSLHPNFMIHLKTARSHQLITDLRKSQLQLGIVVGDKPPRGLISEVAYEDSFGLYASPNLHQSRSNELIYFDFPMNDVKSSIQRFKFGDFVSCDNLETVKALTEEGLGIGLLPHRVARDGVLAGKLINFKSNKIKVNDFDHHNIYLASTKNSDRSPSLVFFRQELLRFLKIWANQ